MSHLLPRISACLIIGTTTSIIYNKRIPLTTFYLTQQLQNTTDTTINISIPFWYHYIPNSENFIQLLIDAITAKKILLTEK